MANYYVGFDCGTMGTKVAIFSEDSTMIVAAYRPHKIEYPQPGWVAMEPGQFYTAVKEGMLECIAKSHINPSSIRAISCSGVICGIVPIDEDWKAVGPYLPYLDNRAKDEALFVSRNIEPVWEEENGTSIVGAFIPPMILRWLLKNEKNMMAKAKKVVTCAHYVLGRMAGLKAKDAFIDFSHLSGWLLGYDGHTRDWSERQLNLLGIPRELLPRVTKPWDCIGALTKAVADEMGLVAGIPLIAGGGDMQQSCLGSGVIEAGICSDVAGTASNFNYAVTDFKQSITKRKELMVANHTLEDLYLYWAIIPGGGLGLRWFRDEVVDKENDDAFYKHMDEAGMRVDLGAGGLLYIPYIQGRTNPVWPNASAGWLGLYASGNSASMWRSMLESIAFEYYGWINALEQEEIHPKRIVGQGGGSKSAFWNQIKADVINTEYVTLKNNEQAVLGNAMLAAYGVGDVSDLRATAKKWVTYQNSFKPDAANHERYLKIYEKRQMIINGPLKEIFDLLANK